MEHKVFRIVASIAASCIFGAITAFNYFTLSGSSNVSLKLSLKICPSIILLMLTIFYIMYYKNTIYSFLTSIFLSFCLMGDVLLALYEPKLAGDVNNKTVFLILGGSAFLIGRIILLFAFALNKCKLINYNIKKMLISHVVFNIPFITLGVLNLVYNKFKIISIIILLYAFFGFGFQLSYAFLRINAIREESTYSSIFGFLGIFLFNISDVLLLSAVMFTPFFPDYVITISDDYYWLGLFLITISIVRYPKTSLEKENYYLENPNYIWT